jgi:hypothetical protein
MEAIEELSELSESMRQAASLLADDDPSDDAAPRRPTTFLNAVALGNVVSIGRRYRSAPPPETLSRSAPAARVLRSDPFPDPSVRAGSRQVGCAEQPHRSPGPGELLA